MIRAAYAFVELGLGSALLVGREEQTRRNMALVGVTESDKLKNRQRTCFDQNPAYTHHLYSRLQRHGLSAARRAAHGQQRPQRVQRIDGPRSAHADGMVAGVTRSYNTTLEKCAACSIRNAAGG